MTSTTAPERGNALSLTDLGSVGSMLLLHRTDRWYLGDFLRHACWLGWAERNLPNARVDLATHPGYLPMYADGRFGSMLKAATLMPADLVGYDLVVEPTSFPITGAPAPGIRGLLRTWDRGWALYVPGREVAHGTKDELNYFRTSHPRSLGLADTTSAGAHVEGTPLSFTDTEQQAARALLDEMAPGEGPVLVYNPTASNQFTRETSVVKEVDNTLTAAEHAAVLRQIMLGITGHAILVAAPVKPADWRNAAVVRSVAASVAEMPMTTGLREFAALLADPRVCSTVGGGTGSNTHLAALVGTWSLSIERMADEAMRANWSRPQEFQMGSFRWRNPSLLTAAHAMHRDEGDGSATEARLTGASGAFLTHHCLAHGAHGELFDRHQTRADALRWWSGTENADIQLGQVLTTWMTAAAGGHLGDFADEITYLRHRFPHRVETGSPTDLAALLAAAGDTTPPADPTVRTLAEQLFRDSNLYKLISPMTAPTGQQSAPDAREGVSR
jgi:hypothetical protein